MKLYNQAQVGMTKQGRAPLLSEGCNIFEAEALERCGSGIHWQKKTRTDLQGDYWLERS